jgi:hypothetical protein
MRMCNSCIWVMQWKCRVHPKRGVQS